MLYFIKQFLLDSKFRYL